MVSRFITGQFIPTGILLFFLLSGISSFGQQVIPISNLESTPSLLNESSGHNMERLRSLLYELQPAAYFMDGTRSYHGDQALVLYVDEQGLSAINQERNKLTEIELVSVELQNPNSGFLNQEVFRLLPGLKFIVFNCEACPESQIRNMLRSWGQFLGDRVLIVYNTEIPN